MSASIPSNNTFNLFENGTYRMQLNFMQKLANYLEKNTAHLHIFLLEQPIKEMILFWVQNGWLKQDNQWKKIIFANAHLLQSKPSISQSYLLQLNIMVELLV